MCSECLLFLEEIMGSKLKYFSLLEWLLWSGSSTVIIAVFLIFDRSNYLNLIASLLGAAALILLAKGNPIGHILIIIFGIIYGIISFHVHITGR